MGILSNKAAVLRCLEKSKSKFSLHIVTELIQAQCPLAPLC